MKLRGNNSSNIPFARACLVLALKECSMDATARRYCKLALANMTRAPAVRRAPTKQRPITSQQKHAVKVLQHTTLTGTEIANKVGLANAGRVSEIMTGVRR
jgi:hypothetical protein